MHGDTAAGLGSRSHRVKPGWLSLPPGSHTGPLLEQRLCRFLQEQQLPGLHRAELGASASPARVPREPAISSFMQVELCPPSPPLPALRWARSPESSDIPGVQSATTQRWPHLPQRQSGAEHGDISFGGTRALWGPRLLCAKSQPTADLAAKLESTQMTELIIKPSTEPELIPVGCYWAFAVLLFYGTPAKRMSIIAQLRTHTFPARGALCLLPSPKSPARRCSSLAAAVPAARSSVPGAGIGQACAGKESPAAALLPAPLLRPFSLSSSP